jgi:hypothetical protein
VRLSRHSLAVVLLKGFIETKLETWMGLEINREKTRALDLKQKGASLDFLGTRFATTAAGMERPGI